MRVIVCGGRNFNNVAYVMGHALGYAGDRNSIQASMGRIERSDAVPNQVARLATMFVRHGVPDEFLPAD